MGGKRGQKWKAEEGEVGKERDARGSEERQRGAGRRRERKEGSGEEKGGGGEKRGTEKRNQEERGGKDAGRGDREKGEEKKGRHRKGERVGETGKIRVTQADLEASRRSKRSPAFRERAPNPAESATRNHTRGFA